MNDLLRYHPLYESPEGAGSGGGSGTGDGGTGEGTPGGSATTPPAGNEGGTGRADDVVPASEAREARNEAKNLRDRLRAAEKERDDLKAATLSETEKAQKERDDAKAAVTASEARIRSLQVQVLASKVGIVDPEAAATLLNWDNVSDPDDQKSVEKALRDLVKEKPYLAGGAPGGSDGGAGDGNGAGTNDMNARIRAAAGRA